MNAATYRVLGCNDEQTTCDFCGRAHLKKTVILEDISEENRGATVRVGTSCAIRAQAVPGVRTAAQMNRHISAAQAEIRTLLFRVEQSRAVLADGERLARNWQVAINAPSGPGRTHTMEDERARWQHQLTESVADLRQRGGGGVSDPIEEELAAAQAAYLAAPIRRRAAVKAALDAGWSQYRIAKLWGVHHNSVAKIVGVIERAR